MGKGFCRVMGKFLQIKYILGYRWMRDFSKYLFEPRVSSDIGLVEFDEVWYFVGLKKEDFGFLWLVDCSV